MPVDEQQPPQGLAASLASGTAPLDPRPSTSGMLSFLTSVPVSRIAGACSIPNISTKGPQSVELTNTSGHQ